MNVMSELEMQLRSWTLRRPSPALERRLFAARPPATLPAGHFSWLAPATAVLALMCVLFNQRYPFSDPAAAGAVPIVAMILSNQSAPAYLPGSFQAEQNNIPANVFRSAGRPGAGPGAFSLPPSRTTNRP